MKKSLTDPATKADLKKLAESSKADIARLEKSTKADIARLENSTKADIASLDKKIGDKFEKLEDKMDLQDMNQSMKTEEFKQELLDKMEENNTKLYHKIYILIDGFAKEILDNRQEREISGHQIHRNTKRIESLEKKVFGKIQINHD